MKFMEFEAIGLKKVVMHMYDKDGFIRKFDSLENQTQEEYFRFSYKDTITCDIKFNKVQRLNLMTGVPKNIIHKMLYSKKLRTRWNYYKKYIELGGGVIL